MTKPSHPFDYVSRDQVQDLWSIGYTIVKRVRGPDPFHVPPEMVPQGRSYQWWHLIHDKFHFQRTAAAANIDEGQNSTGWAPVPASRHDGYFMPLGHVGPIEVGGLGLFEKSKFEVDQEKAQQIAAVHQQTADWAKKTEDLGISGDFSIDGVGFEVGVSPDGFKRGPAKTIETIVKVPRDMFPHMNEVFAERDRLYGALQDKWTNGEAFDDWETGIVDKYEAARREDPDILKGPTFNALLLPIAVENVRAKLKEGKTDE